MFELDIVWQEEELFCFGGVDGSFIVEIEGGVLFFFWFWDSGVVLNFIQGLFVGSYSLIIIDGYDCNYVF